jgi:isopenicillin N synthase-like dioxygenase
MGSLDSDFISPSLPVLSLESPDLPRDLYAACRDHGFFYLTDHGIPPSALRHILSLARRFFLESSVDEKNLVKRRPTSEGGDAARGYQVLNENVTKGLRDFHEAVDFYREFDDQETTHNGPPTTKKYEFLHGPNLWPKHPPELKQVYEEYIEQCKEVGTKLLTAMGEALSLDGDEHDTFVTATRKSFWVMRMIGYPPLQNSKDEAGVSCGEHSGIFLFTSNLTKPDR